MARLIGYFGFLMKEVDKWTEIRVFHQQLTRHLLHSSVPIIWSYMVFVLMLAAGVAETGW